MFNDVFAFFFLNHTIYDKVEKYFTAGKATDDNMAYARCMLYT